tara:strand:+ start:2441 stop:3283 length:843 start_codon:yes stop_codon:yes gene_type:complete
MSLFKNQLASLHVKSPLIMGILNVTPDSFFDGNRFNTLDKALTQARSLVASGADILDIGGESTKPYAAPVSLDEELSRVIPVIERVTQEIDVTISIDTYKPEVMQAAVQAGAQMINDVKALQAPGALSQAAKLNVPVCLMHMQGTPQSMQNKPTYQDTVDDVMQFFEERIAACIAEGMSKENMILDPGFGFGKTLEDNYKLLAHLKRFKQFNLPMLVGVSNKSMIGDVLDKPSDQRLIGTVTASLMAYQQGADIIRVHDVGSMRDSILIMQVYNKFEREL